MPRTVGYQPTLSWLRTLAVAVVVLASTAAFGDDLIEPPVPIRTQTPFVPAEAAGSDVAPEAKVKASLDARGRVTQVEVLSIKPSTELDALFEKALVTEILRHRYAPQRRNGIAEPTDLEWIVRFPSKPAHRDQTFGATGELPGADAEGLRSQILALREDQRSELLNAQARKASSLLLGVHHQVSTDRFVVHTDSDEATAQTIGHNLEAIFLALGRDLVPRIQPIGQPYKVQVFVYRERSSYQEFLSEMPSFEWSTGFYSPAGLIAFHLQQPSNEAVMSLLLHETTHAFMDRRVVRQGVAMPRWLGEGFADYVGNSLIKKGQLIPGRLRKGTYESHGGNIQRVDTVGKGMLEAARRELRNGKGLGVRELLSASRETFYGEQRKLFYDSAWLFVHFLREGEPTWANERFPALMLYLAEGYPADAAFRQVYGDIDAADEAFRAYVKQF